MSDATLAAAITAAQAAGDYTALAGALEAWRAAQAVPTGSVQAQDLTTDAVLATEGAAVGFAVAVS